MVGNFTINFQKSTSEYNLAQDEYYQPVGACGISPSRQNSPLESGPVYARLKDNPFVSMPRLAPAVPDRSLKPNIGPTYHEGGAPNIDRTRKPNFGPVTPGPSPTAMYVTTKGRSMAPSPGKSPKGNKTPDIYTQIDHQHTELLQKS